MTDIATTPPRRTSADPPSSLRRRSRAAVARSAGGDRRNVGLLGLVLLVAGVLVALLAYGVFGAERAGGAVLDPTVVGVLESQLLITRIVAILVGVLLAVLGLMWTARSLRSEGRPDLVLDAGPDTQIVVNSGAAADVVTAQAGALPGVQRARTRLVGPDRSPALRVTLWLGDDADVNEVLRSFDEQVLTVARTSLGLRVLPVAVRLELDSATSGPRVA